MVPEDSGADPVFLARADTFLSKSMGVSDAHWLFQNLCKQPVRAVR